MAAADIVRRQVNAFNSQDLEAFLATYAADAVVTGVAAQPLVGSRRLREFYARRLRDASLRCVLDTVVTFGERWVVAREQITSGATTTETIAMFDVVDGLIQRASMLKA